MHQQQYLRVVSSAFHLVLRNANALRQSHERQRSVDLDAVSLGLEPWWHGSDDIGRSSREILDWPNPAENRENGQGGCGAICS